MIHLHDLLHALVTGRTRPRPGKGDEMHPIPVMILLTAPGADAPASLVPATGWAFEQATPDRTDDAGTVVPGRPARLVIRCVVPPRDVPPAGAPVPVPTEPPADPAAAAAHAWDGLRADWSDLPHLRAARGEGVLHPAGGGS